MYKVAVSLFVLLGLATGAGAQDLLIEQDSAGEVAGHYQSLDASFYAAIDPGGVTVAEITLNGKVFAVQLQGPRIQELHIAPLRPKAARLKNRVDSEKLADLYRRLSSELDQTRGEVRVLLRFIDYLVEFFPENEAFDGIVRGSGQMAEPFATTPLCDNRGVLTQGTYSPRLNPLDFETEFAIIGDPVSDCLGRCGIACLQVEGGGQFLTPARAYTQGCFDHDLCVGATGDTLGNCSDEFLIASDDYLVGPNCEADITGTWEVISYRNEGEVVQTSRATVIFFADGTMRVVNGPAGAWLQRATYFEFSAAGQRFVAYGSARDLVLEGRMDQGGEPVGYWTAVHLTTATD